jgi:hypothetical protein
MSHKHRYNDLPIIDYPLLKIPQQYPPFPSQQFSSPYTYVGTQTNNSSPYPSMSLPQVNQVNLYDRFTGQVLAKIKPENTSSGLPQQVNQVNLFDRFTGQVVAQIKPEDTMIISTQYNNNGINVTISGTKKNVDKTILRLNMNCANILKLLSPDSSNDAESS